ncbi:MAG: phosphotransferase family protein [Haliscomenobacter sp.]|nr:phosphotransferase family protein [Haliscomenobacter sp.]MBK8878075.1 phosphotransferase family protein [Haliscomenobacter sp.]
MIMDEAKDIRPGEELPVDSLQRYLESALPEFQSILDVQQFPGGFSNLTYLIETNLGQLVLRRPPFGTHVKTAHDMGREFRVLTSLQPVYSKIPKPVLLCEDPEVLGAPFYLMERVEGVILRNRPQKDLDLNPGVMKGLSEAFIDNLADLHNLDIDSAGLGALGKPEGYIARQVEGWIERYYRAETEPIGTMNLLADWMRTNSVPDGSPSLLHNDYKYDNLVLDPENLTRIRAVLDWEMCTIGDPRMDLGLSMAYWIEPEEINPLVASIGNLTWLPGNLSREGLLERYASRKGGKGLEHILFFFVFGLFKIGVIVQQIYYRYKQGHTQDPRFAPLIEAVHWFGDRGRKALELDGVKGS